MQEQINLSNQAATERFARALGSILLPGDFVALYGDLGTGKTTLARALIQGLNPAESEVPSPTFTLVQVYDSPKGPLAHLDLYRVGDASEIHALGWDDLRSGIMLVEWPERLGNLLPASHIGVSLTYGEQESARVLTINADAAKLAALKEQMADG